MESFNFLREEDARRKSGLSRTVRWEREQVGLFPPSIKLSARAAAWLEHEIDAVNRAVAAGASDTQLRHLVKKLVAQRREAAHL